VSGTSAQSWNARNATGVEAQDTQIRTRIATPDNVAAQKTVPTLRLAAMSIKKLTWTDFNAFIPSVETMK
jgi:hypothetical protein